MGRNLKMQNSRERWMKQAIDLAIESVRGGRGGPFGAVVVKDGQVLSTGVNLVTASNDPTAHAEIVALRGACQALRSFQLEGCQLYASCEPCPMCLGAIYWARPKAYYFASTRSAAAEAGFDDAFISDQLRLPAEKRAIPGEHVAIENALEPFIEWARSAQKVRY